MKGTTEVHEVDCLVVVLQSLFELQSRNSNGVIIKSQMLHDVVHELHLILDTSLQVASARSIALNCKNEDDIMNMNMIHGGLSVPLVHTVLKQAVEEFVSSISTNRSTNTSIHELNLPLASRMATTLLHKILTLHLQLINLDITLAEEMARCGSHVYLSKLIFLDPTQVLKRVEQIYPKNVEKHIIEDDEDILTDIQDLACEIAHDSRLPYLTFPVKISPFTYEELKSRLPLEFHVQSPYYRNNDSLRGGFHIENEKTQRDIIYSKDNMISEQMMTFLIQQVTDRQSAQEDVGFVMWPSAVALSSWLLANKSILYNKQILELGAGCGLTGLVASRIVHEYHKSLFQESHNHDEKKGQCYDIKHVQGKHVILTDFNQKVLFNLDRNINLNELNHVAETTQLDFYVQQGTNYDGGWITKPIGNISSDNVPLPPVDMILAADVICKPSDSVAVSKTIYDVLKPGGEAIIISANAKHRFGVDIFEHECELVGLKVEITDVAELCDGKLLPQTAASIDPCGIRQTSGFVDGMSLTMFRITKPC